MINELVEGSAWIWPPVEGWLLLPMLPLSVPRPPPMPLLLPERPLVLV